MGPRGIGRAYVDSIDNINYTDFDNPSKPQASSSAPHLHSKFCKHPSFLCRNDANTAAEMNQKPSERVELD